MLTGKEPNIVKSKEMDRLHNELQAAQQAFSQLLADTAEIDFVLVQQKMLEIKQLKDYFESIDKSMRSIETIAKYSETGEAIEVSIRKARALTENISEKHDSITSSVTQTDVGQHTAALSSGLLADNNVVEKIKTAQQWVADGILNKRSITDTSQLDSDDVAALLRAKVHSDPKLNNSSNTTLACPVYDLSRFVEHIDKLEKQKFLEAKGEVQNRDLSTQERAQLNQQCSKYLQDNNPMYMMLKAMENDQALLNQCGANGKSLLDCQQLIIPVRHPMEKGEGHHFTSVNISITPDPDNEGQKLISVSYIDSFKTMKAGDPYVDQLLEGAKKFVEEHADCKFLNGVKIATGSQKESYNCGLFAVANGIEAAKCELSSTDELLTVTNELAHLPSSYDNNYHVAMMQQREQAVDIINSINKSKVNHIKYSETSLSSRHKELVKLNAKFDDEINKKEPNLEKVQKIKKDYDKLLTRVAHHKEQSPKDYENKIAKINRIGEINTAISKMQEKNLQSKNKQQPKQPPVRTRFDKSKRTAVIFSKLDLTDPRKKKQQQSNSNPNKPAEPTHGSDKKHKP